MNRGMLIVVSAPSGCGKGTILHEIMNDGGYYYSISSTTRKPRNGEVNGVHYDFLTKEQFEEKINAGEMLEYACYCDNYYGTPKTVIEEKLSQGIDVILEIETNGAEQVMKKCPDAVSVFILPPSVKELERRLLKRGTETIEVIQKRVAEAASEIEKSRNYKYLVMNDGLEQAIEDFRAIINAERLKYTNSKEIVDEVLKNA